MKNKKTFISALFLLLNYSIAAQSLQSKFALNEKYKINYESDKVWTFTVDVGAGIPLGRMGNPGSEPVTIAYTSTSGGSSLSGLGTGMMPYGISSTGFSLFAGISKQLNEHFSFKGSLGYMTNPLEGSKLNEAADKFAPGTSSAISGFTSKSGSCYAFLIGPELSFNTNEKLMLDFSFLIGLAQINGGSYFYNQSSTGITLSQNIESSSSSTFGFQMSGFLNYSLSETSFLKFGASYFQASKSLDYTGTADLTAQVSGSTVTMKQIGKYAQTTDVTLFIPSIGLGIKF